MSLPARSDAWKWWVCGLLLLATTINYMDRLTLNLQKEELGKYFGFNNYGYGLLEAAFGSAFAIGAIVMGWLADRVNVRLLYPAAVLLWSLAGLATGLVDTFALLLVCRFALGFAEAGNWPCALRTTQHILPPEKRTMGNSILQSGAALGAILTPLLLLLLARQNASWRWSFILVGAVGALWAVAWLLAVRASDLDVPRRPKSHSLMAVLGWLIGLLVVDSVIHLAWEDWLGLPAEWTAAFRTLPAVPLVSKVVTTVLGIALVGRWLMRATDDDTYLPRGLFFRRYVALAVTVVAINVTWHYLRAWLPPYLQTQPFWGGEAYSKEQLYLFSLYYYIATDVGSLAAGFFVLVLARTALGVHASRLVVYALFSLLALLASVAVWFPSGGGLEPILLVVGFGSLGLFPVYYSLSQDLTRENQGKVTGSLGCICWLAMSLMHEAVGKTVEQSGSYTQAFTLAGVAPLVGLAAVLLLWGPWTVGEHK